MNTTGNICDWAKGQTDASMVLRSITKDSPRLGMLLACRVAREALRFVPEGNQRPLQAIEAAERLVRGEATEEDRDLVSVSYADYSAATKSAFYAAFVIYSAALVGAADADAASSTAIAVAHAYADATTDKDTDADAWEIARDSELNRLCGVIAEDLFTGRTAEILKV